MKQSVLENLKSIMNSASDSDKKEYQQIIKSYQKLDKIIKLPTLISNGTTGPQFISKMEKANLTIGSYAAGILQSDDFAKSVTTGIKYLPGVIKGSEFTDSERTTENIRKYATERGGITPPVQLSPMLRLVYSDEEIKKMGLLWLVGMHEPIKGSGGDLRLLGLDADDPDCQLLAFSGDDSDEWGAETGFVFLFPQLSSIV